MTMLRKIIASAVSVGLAATAFGELRGTLAENTTQPTSGPQAGIPRSLRATFDLTLETNADWAGATLRVLVTPAGQAAGITISHAQGQPSGAAAPWGNISSPDPATAADSSVLLYDTFLAGSPIGLGDADPNNDQPYGAITTLGTDVMGDGVAGRVVTTTEIGARNPQDAPIQLPWLDTTTTDAGSFLGARLTFTTPDGLDLSIGTGTALVTIEGAVADVDNTSGSAFSFTLVPEPGTLALLVLGGLAGLIRRR